MSQEAALDPILDAGPVIAVVTLERLEAAVPMAEALVEGGLRVIEITLRTEAALDGISAIADRVAGAIVGAGTILAPGDLDRAADAGAAFCVSPGLTPALLDAAPKVSIPLLPGIATAGELMTGLAAGLTRFKLFPAEAVGGKALLKSLTGPFPQVRFCPTGGITVETAPAYLALKAVACVGGSWLTPAELQRERAWAEIKALAQAAAGLSAG